MHFWHSVRFRTVFGFFLIVAPLVIFMIYTNLYATRIVREQISLHYNNLMSVQVKANDEILGSTRNFLVQLGTINDSDILALKTLPAESPDFTLAKLRLYNRILLDMSYYKMVDTFFIYSTKDNSPVFATQNGYKSPELDAYFREFFNRIREKEQYVHEWWDVVSIPGDFQYLSQVIDMDFGTYSGALVQLDVLNQVLASFDVGPDGAAYMVDSEGHILTSGPLPPAQDESFRQAVLSLKQPVDTLRWKGKKYLVLQHPSKYADVHYVLTTTEAHILKNLPFFQKMLYYWIPLISVLVVTGYVLFLQRFMFRPLVRFIRGMRRLGQGQFEVRMPEYSEGSEFSIMAKTFNQMAEQIENLKIDVYEEQLRVQRAEYKHLQVQINPHFYMNSLNIIYNLASLKDYRSVQKLSLHLADYFRFMMHSNRATVRLSDEIRHIEHYLEIQKLRYVDKLEYRIDIQPQHQSCEIPPLLLQPFVENAILHGFQQREQDGTPFRILVASENDHLMPDKFISITIRDNGPGFPADMLEELSNGTYMSRSGEQHLGVWNTLRRYQMLYGNEGGFQFSNAPEGGAVVMVRLPISRSAMLDHPGDSDAGTADTDLEDMGYAYNARG